jgi:hypothetical protein
MIILDVRTEGGPALIQMDDALGAEALERDPARYFRRNPHDFNDPRWGTVDKSSGEFVPSGAEPLDPDFTHARGTAIGELLHRQRVEDDRRRRGLAA